MPELWSPGDIRTNLKRPNHKPYSRDTVSKWQRRPDFPAPVMQHGTVRFYDSAEVMAWHTAERLKNPRHRIILNAYREDPERSNTSIAELAECDPRTVSRVLEKFGLRP